VPFFLECPKDETRDRIRLTTDGSTLQGTCPKCKEEYEISYNKNNPDISDYYEFLSPRVDSRSISASQLLKSQIRVTGGGETNYFAQIIPYMRHKKLKSLPFIVKHPRIYYNTPWSEKKGEELKKMDENLRILHEKENFIRMGKIAKMTNPEELLEELISSKNIINSLYREINDKIHIIENQDNFKKNRKLKQIHQLLNQYLSLTWGKYTSNKYIQEVSWLWIDLILNTGIRDLSGFYLRALKVDMPISPTLWISPGKYN
jgi:hypothetical protein